MVVGCWKRDGICHAAIAICVTVDEDDDDGDDGSDDDGDDGDDGDDDGGVMVVNKTMLMAMMRYKRRMLGFDRCAQQRNCGNDTTA